MAKRKAEPPSYDDIYRTVAKELLNRRLEKANFIQRLILRDLLKVD